MATETPNLHLEKPAENEFYDVKKFNANWDKIDAAVLLALAAAAPYSAQTYALGAYCTRGGRLYRCTTAITAAETWTAGHWTETTVTAELIAHATDLDTKVSKSGDTMTGNLAIEKSYPGIFLNNSTLNRSGVIQSDDSDGSLFIRNQKSENNRTQLMLYGEEKSTSEVLSLYLVKNGVGSFYKVLHSGNKPTGSYTGNGSSTLREIDLTNNVDCRGVIIVSTSGYMALITSQGGIIKNGSDTSVTGLPTTQVNWNDGKIKITSTHDALNKNGETYFYQCL